MFSIQKLLGRDEKFYDLLEASAQQADTSVHHLIGLLQKLEHFAVLDLHIHLHNLGNAQITQRPRRGLHSSFCRILPGLRTRADYFRYSVH